MCQHNTCCSRVIATYAHIHGQPGGRHAGGSGKIARLMLAIFVVLSLALWGMPARAAFPENPITIIVPYPVGGATDTLARAVGQKMAETLGQSVVVENRAGGSGLIGMQATARARPDGYTIVFGCTTDSAILTAAAKNAPSVNLRDDFQAVAGVALAPHILVVPAQSPATSVASLVEALNAAPGKHNFSSIGVGTLSHLEGELLMLTTGVDIVHVPYRGGSQALAELISGNSSLMFLSTPAAIPFMQNGSVRILAVAADKRLPLIPDVPTIAEAGIKDFNAENLFGFYAPKETPSEVVARLSEAVAQALAQPSLTKLFESQGLETHYADPATFTRQTADNFQAFRQIVERAGIVLE